MYYDGINYFDDNEFCSLEGYLTNGDRERLDHISYINNIPTSNVSDAIKFVIREYYKEHNVAERMQQITGQEYKNYDDFLEKLRKKNKNFA